MGAPVAYFDLLEDGVVQEVILRINEPARDSWQSLSSTCRRMCSLVRATRAVKIQCDKAIYGLQQLLHLPSSRAFCDVRVLSVTSYEDRSMAEWACFSDALAAAAATWPSMEEVLLNAKLMEKRQYNNHECKPGCLSSPLMALRHASALRRLIVKLHEDHSFSYLPLLTQLAHLELSCEQLNLDPDMDYEPLSLAAMSNLVSLQLGDVLMEMKATCVLPPSLTRFEANLGSYGIGDWAEHLAGCRWLRELELMVPWCEMHLHPTRLIQGFAEQLMGLVTLGIHMDDHDFNNMKMGSFLGDLHHNSPEEWGPVDAEALKQLPLILNGDVLDAALHAIIPPPNLSALSSLQVLDVSGWWLVATSERYWRTLAGCSSLRSLHGLHASVPPPAGVTFPHLTFLEVTTSTSPGDTLALLGAFPALEGVRLTVVPISSGADELPVVHPGVMQRLAAAYITFKWPSKYRFDPHPVTVHPHGPPAVAYCTPLWAALPGLQLLILVWPCSVPRSALPLQGRAALRQTAALALGALQQGATEYQEGLLPVHVEAGQLLPALQGATQLLDLELRMELDPSSRDQAVLGLQEALPRLTQLVTLDGAAGLAPATLATLRPGLLHALIAG